MSIKWDKVGAIAGVVALLLGGLAILVQLTTAELRCYFGLDKNGCSHVDKPSLKAVPQVTQSPIATPLPYLAKQKPDIGVKPSLPSPQAITIEKAKDLQDKLAGAWIYTSACEVNGELVIHNKVMVFNNNRTITEIIGLTSTKSKSTFFSTKTTKISADIQVTYEWSIEEAFLYMKIVDRVASLADISVNGKSVKVNDSSVIRIKNVLESSFLRGQTIKYKILGVEEDSIVLEKIGGTRPLCENNFIVKYTRVK